MGFMPFVEMGVGEKREREKQGEQGEDGEDGSHGTLSWGLFERKHKWEETRKSETFVTASLAEPPMRR